MVSRDGAPLRAVPVAEAPAVVERHNRLGTCPNCAAPVETYGSLLLPGEGGIRFGCAHCAPGIGQVIDMARTVREQPEREASPVCCFCGGEPTVERVTGLKGRLACRIDGDLLCSAAGALAACVRCVTFLDAGDEAALVNHSLAATFAQWPHEVPHVPREFAEEACRTLIAGYQRLRRENGGAGWEE